MAKEPTKFSEVNYTNKQHNKIKEFMCTLCEELDHENNRFKNFEAFNNIDNQRICNQLNDIFINYTFEYLQNITKIFKDVNDMLVKLYQRIYDIEMLTEKDALVDSPVVIDFVNCCFNLNQYFDGLKDPKIIKVPKAFSTKEYAALMSLYSCVEMKQKEIADVLRDLEVYKKDTQSAVNEVNVIKTDTLNKLEVAKREAEERVTALKDYLTKYESECQHNKEVIAKQSAQLKSQLSELNESAARELLSGYFKDEAQKLKGSFNAIILFVASLLSILLVLIVKCNYFETIFSFATQKPLVNIFTIGWLYAMCLAFTDWGFRKFSKDNKDQDSKDNKVDKNQENKNSKEICGLITPYWCWLYGIFLGMGSIMYLALEIYGNNFVNIQADKDMWNLLPNFPLFMVLVWFTWFCVKQFSYTKQICDEYEYKYALAKTYIGFREEANGLATDNNGQAILVALLDAVIKNMANSPVKSIGHDVCTPFSEILEAATKLAKKSENSNNR